MGRRLYSHDDYDSAVKKYASTGGSVTARGSQHIKETGKLNPLVDPSEFGVIRESRIRLEERPDHLFEVVVGTPLSIEYRLDTTGSMGDNVQRALKALPSICGLSAAAVPERDHFFCASIFGDVQDNFVLCRGQFEVLAERMVDQLTLMNPESDGADHPEDPHYGFFGGAYLTNAYLHRIGLKSFDFTVTDAPCHDRLSTNNLTRVFGPEVFDKVRDNGHTITPSDLPTCSEIVVDLKKRAHAFMLLVNKDSTSYWNEIFGKEHVVILPEIEFVPHVMATIIGLVEGNIDLQSAVDFLTSQGVDDRKARLIVQRVANIPLGAQRALPNFPLIPVKGSVFRNRTDLWPINPDEVPKKAKRPPKRGWL